MSTPPLVSVIVPCFNCAATVDATLESISRQSEPRLEIICVDDSSTDATAERLANWAVREPRLVVIRQANGGCAAARNRGLAAARGSFIALIDADDLWAPDYLARHLARFDADPGLGVSFTRIHFINHDGSPTGETTRPKLSGITPQDILEHNPAGCAMMVARREVFAEVGPFNHRLRRAEDQEWLFRVALTRWRIEGIDAPLADYRNSPAGLSANLDAQLEAYRDLLDHVEQLAPEIVRSGRRRAVASMQLFCARRALRLGLGPAEIRRHLAAALKGAPELLMRQPRSVAGLALAALSPAGASGLLRALR
jgi:glycosyltransferase involved in cell wall biosynthesis